MKHNDVYLKIYDFIAAEYCRDIDVYNSAEDCRVMLLNDVSRADFDAGKAKFLSQFNFKKVNENSIDNNYFTHCNGDGYIVVLGYFGCDNTIRVVFDSDTNAPQTDVVNYRKIGKTTLWQFEINHSLIDCGMCYILRTAAGKFFIKTVTVHY